MRLKSGRTISPTHTLGPRFQLAPSVGAKAAKTTKTSSIEEQSRCQLHHPHYSCLEAWATYIDKAKLLNVWSEEVFHGKKGIKMLFADAVSSLMTAFAGRMGEWRKEGRKEGRRKWASMMTSRLGTFRTQGNDHLYNRRRYLEVVRDSHTPSKVY